jgi:hypothetical protein
VVADQVRGIAAPTLLITGDSTSSGADAGVS